MAQYLCTKQKRTRETKDAKLEGRVLEFRRMSKSWLELKVGKVAENSFGKLRRSDISDEIAQL
jgi:hypothetical protein